MRSSCRVPRRARSSLLDSPSSLVRRMPMNRTSKVNPVPDGHHTLTPYLICDGAAAALDFYKRAFGAEELFRMEGPAGKIGHAEMRIGDSRFMLADCHPE